MAQKKNRKKAWGFSSDSQTLDKCLQEFERYLVKKTVVKGTKNGRTTRETFFIEETSFGMLADLGLCKR